MVVFVVVFVLCIPAVKGLSECAKGAVQLLEHHGLAADGIAWQLGDFDVAGGIVCVIAVDMLTSSDSTSSFARLNASRVNATFNIVVALVGALIAFLVE